MNQTKEKLLLARTKVQHLIEQQEKIISEIKEDLGLKNTSELLARSYICHSDDEVWLDKTLTQLLFLLSDPEA